MAKQASKTANSETSINIDKPGFFYLGKIITEDQKKDIKTEPLFYNSKNFTTHAVCVGMTGSGKTGLGISLIEEAGLNKIPSILIDPKGDLGNLMLSFPNLEAQDFLPWIDKSEAERKGLDANQYAEEIAKTWKEGLASSHENPERIKKLRDSVDIEIYTPANNAGIQISILNSFKAPSKQLMADSGAVRDKVISTTSSILGLLGIDADPIKSREHILISTIITESWNKGIDLDITSLIQQVLKPPFSKIGALDIDMFFSAKERKDLSIKLNNLLASPGFQAWMNGIPLDIDNLLFTKEGKPKIAILSIAHLSDQERMFFVTLFLNEFISWMRRQPGTSSLRALLYMDEIFGFFPPVKMPPSKTPMLTLLKQARAYGLGVILATQNPVDLDYKGLSNCGTWFIGKLQTSKDLSRVVEGLELASNGEINGKVLEKLLSSIKNRTFLLRSIYEKEPILFQTRWTLSYLSGPLTLTQIDKLVDKSKISQTYIASPEKKSETALSKPLTSTGIEEYYLIRSDARPPVLYRPHVIGIAKLHYTDTKRNLDLWKEECILAPVEKNGETVYWEKGATIPEGKQSLSKEPLPNSQFQELPAGLSKEKNYADFQKSFFEFLIQFKTLKMYQIPDLGLYSRQGESESDFRNRIAPSLLERKENDIRQIRERYEKKIDSISEKIRRAELKLSQKQQNATMQKTDTWLSFATTILGAVFGRKVTKGTISDAGRSIKRAGKMSKDSQEVAAAEQECQLLKNQLDDLQREMQNEITKTSVQSDSNTVKIDTFSIPPRRSDIQIEKVALTWLPIMQNEM